MSLLEHLAATNQMTQYTKGPQSVFDDDHKDYETPTQNNVSTTNKKYDENGHEIMEFFTDYGTQRISIDGDIASGKPIIMTYHDVGINHNACFSSFFNMMKEFDAKWKYFTIIHIDAPQHHYKDSTTENAHDRPKFVHDDNIQAFDLLELSTQIEDIRSKLQIDRFMAFGIGASCNIWTYYAMNYSQRLRGMVLINGIASECGWREWVFDSLVSKMGTSSQFLRDTLMSSLMSRYFPAPVSQETYDYFWSEFDRIDADSVMKYARGFARRQQLNEKQLSKIKTKSLIICGERSRVREETIAFQKMMPRVYTTFELKNDIGFLLTESNPQKLCSSVNLFVESLGLTEISLKSKFGPLKNISM